MLEGRIDRIRDQALEDVTVPRRPTWKSSIPVKAHYDNIEQPQNRT